VSLDRFRSFALGELGWSLHRWQLSTLYEFNQAAEGYWRNWERNTAWLMREIVFTLITGNPNIKQGDKPINQMELWSITDDKNVIEKKRERCKTTPKELDRIKNMLFEGLNNLKNKQ